MGAHGTSFSLRLPKILLPKLSSNDQIGFDDLEEGDQHVIC